MLSHGYVFGLTEPNRTMSCLHVITSYSLNKIYLMVFLSFHSIHGANATKTLQRMKENENKKNKNSGRQQMLHI